MRNYIHVMLCTNLFISQLIFLVGIEQTHYSVSKQCIKTLTKFLSCSTVGLCRDSCCFTVHVSSIIHVDANGRHCVICYTSKGLH